ncbi:MAG: hypothetical protein LBO82_02025 [Synergistaceae bacterium]|nr:hypothetical protein [Synergistaceae bacterium]
MNDVSEIRKALIEAIPYTTANYGETPDTRYIYTPLAHEKALRLETNLVVGARGVGKSFWTAAINDEGIRSELGNSMRELKTASVYIGFSTKDNIAAYPDQDTFARLLGGGFTAYEIWRAVASRWLSEIAHCDIPRGDWPETVGWVKDNPEQVTKLFQGANAVFESEDRRGLILFDALDRCSDNWQKMDGIVRDLLRVALWLKSYSRIYVKIFLRTDQFSRQIMDFPDASKILATMVELTWQVHDLHGLLWQLLCNAPDEYGETLRKLYEEALGRFPAQKESRKESGAWSLTDKEKHDGKEQRNLFEKLAGPYMGTDQRRGIPYVWSVRHLADGKGQTSPRSFLVAIRSAAEDSLERYPDHKYALHYESIKRGVQKASSVRIGEVTEDYPWITKLLSPLEKLNVPCDFSVVEARWDEEFPSGAETLPSKDRLPPQSLKEGWLGIRKDLERIGLFEILQDGRINMPDLYRIGFKLGRKGGVRPISKG